MFHALLQKAAAKSNVYNMSCDLKRLLAVFPRDPIASSRYLIAFAEDVALAMENSVSSDELVVRTGNQIGDTGHPALGFMLCTLIEGVAAAQQNHKPLAAQRLAAVDQIFKQQVGVGVDVSQRGPLSRLLL